MTLTIDGKPIQLHPVTADMIAALVKKQDIIAKCGCGRVELDFHWKTHTPRSVHMKIFDAPIISDHAYISK